MVFVPTTGFEPWSLELKASLLPILIPIEAFSIQISAVLTLNIPNKDNFRKGQNTFLLPVSRTDQLNYKSFDGCSQ